MILEVGLPYQKATAIRFMIADTTSAAVGEAYDLTGVSLVCGVKSRGYRDSRNQSNITGITSVGVGSSGAGSGGAGGIP
jgi:hypothetical protein